MYLLDTMVLSELRKGQRSHERVRAWAAANEQSYKAISVLTILEIRSGALRVERRDAAQAAVLAKWTHELTHTLFRGRVLPVTLDVVERCAFLHVPRQRNAIDTLIAATALVHNLTVVTRNTRHFEPTGVPTLNPWLGMDQN